MIRYAFFLLLLFVLSCQSVRKHNAFLDREIPVAKLRSDVDFTYDKLKRFHPHLYWYISKDTLDHKFDSIKNTITHPMRPNDFYFKLAPVVASVNEGHLRLRPIFRQSSRKEEKALKDKKPLFGMMDYRIVGDRLFVRENKQNFATIKAGTEILKINGDSVADLISKYNSLSSSDGENKTFQKYYINQAFFSLYTLEHGFLDSARLTTQCDNQISEIIIRRQKKSDSEITKDKETPKITMVEKVQDYDAASNTYNRSFKFLDKDSTVAYIKVKSFTATYSKKFYKDTFAKIKKANAGYLILDIRDNLGGSLAEINNLYSYLTDQQFTLIKPLEMTSRTSGMHQNYFRGQTWLEGILSAAGYPFFLAGNYFLSKKQDERYYFRDFISKPTKPKSGAFLGKIYVLVNGGSFSASSIISAKLKYEKRATIVGEETGGANDGTVSGVNNTVTLPNSKLTLPIGLFVIRPDIGFDNKNRGVLPDVPLDTGFTDILSRDDRVLSWVMDDIAFRKEVAGRSR